MTDNTNQDLLSAFDALQSADRDEATRRYAAIIKRHDNPKPKDGESLRELMTILGIDRKTVEDDITALKQARELEAALETVKGYQAESEEAGRAVMTAADRLREAEANLKAAQVTSRAAAAKRQMANGCKRELEAIKEKHAYLFTDDASTATD